ncbi:Transient receptor potential cation channel subfamily M member 1 [Strongyloides ratti]|uniref:Transient receptor potential cation channel subfamily M member 1 n=1 Tax=Strongyloides ratti TaxID=34506 RepID=A0A090MYW3_STRRB|nr:Transient receptor potential cation channel subfamily M member 1 [Strongyloides ratti]CEF67884.1 Transient receptor potential cation channel subfamily M member 1 [Strongyloides ratti]
MEKNNISSSSATPYTQADSDISKAFSAVRKLSHYNEVGIRPNRFDRERRHHRKRTHRTEHQIRRTRMMNGANAPPRYVHCSDWKEMLAVTNESKKDENLLVDKIVEAKKINEEEYNDCETSIHSKKDDNEEKDSGSYRSISNIVHSFGRNSKDSDHIMSDNFIEKIFKKRECSQFISTVKDEEKCGCGRLKNDHYIHAFDEIVKSKKNGLEKWSIRKHTVLCPTDAYGTIEFQGGPHPTKANYIRLSFDSDPADIVKLFANVWKIPPPKLIITIHGGMTNFDIQTKLTRVFRKGLLKAARTAGAWIITSGINAGVVRHVAAALDGGASLVGKGKSKIVTIGVAQWGLLKKRDSLIGQDCVVPYHPHSFSTKGKLQVLNNRHSYFLLVDNGTVGRYGADIILRRRLESYIAQKQKVGEGNRGVPIVCVVLEGGTCTIRTVLDYVANIPRVPVVVCDGSGRASDLIAFAHRFVLDNGQLPEGVQPQLLHLIQNVFFYSKPESENLLLDLLECVKDKKMITVFRLGESHKQDVDHAILTALLKGQNLSAPEQLSLALAWNRVDIAKSDIFIMGQHWPPGALNNAMLEALIHDRVAFVRLLLENGVSMSNFLTIERLEDLYNTDKGPPNTLYYIVRDVVKIRSGYRYKLPDIGLAIEKLMGYGFRSTYTSKAFKDVYRNYKKNKANYKFPRNSGFSQGKTYEDNIPSHGSVCSPVIDSASPLLDNSLPETLITAGNRALGNHIIWRSVLRRDNTSTGQMEPPVLVNNDYDGDDDDNSNTCNDKNEFEFRYPFSDLLIWAVLTKRHEMALCMWEHGEEAMAKSLVACRINKALSKEAAEDYLEVEVCEELKQYAEDFRELSLELLDQCYRMDDAQTLQLLTYELSYFGNETCLSLAVLVNNKQFLSHPCCQILLADLWHGGLRIRSNSNLKVILGILCVPTIFFLEFKTREELLLQPQTAAEHEEDINDYDSSTSGSSSSESSDSESSDDFEEDDKYDNDSVKKRYSSESVQSINLTNFFHGRKKKRHNTFSSSGPTSNIVYSKEYQAAEQSQKMSLSHNDNFKKKISSTKDKEVLDNEYRLDIESLNDKYINAKGVSSSYLKNRIGSNEHFMNFINAKQSDGIKAMTIARSKQIKTQRKIYEFCSAPITTFWTWCLSFIFFLIIYAYTLLIKTPPTLNLLDTFLTLYVFSFGCEHVRKFVMSGPKRYKEKFGYFFKNMWYLLTTMAIIGYLTGLGIRAFLPQYRAYGRVVLSVSSVFWTLKLLDFLSVHPKFGPYITMAGKMIQSMSYIVVMLVVSLLSFGLARQAITFPNENWNWILVRNIFYKPYFMLYGEVYAPEIDECGDYAWDEHINQSKSIDEVFNANGKCVPGYWITPILMTIFLLISNILLISMLIAIFNNIFDATDKISQQIWLFQRYRQVMEYESTPFLPPPFTLFYHLYMLFKYTKHTIRKHMINHKFFKKFLKKQYDKEKYEEDRLFDYSLKLFLNLDQVEKLHDFEEECMDELHRQKEYKKNVSTDERILRIAERSEQLVYKFNDIVNKENNMNNSLRDMESRIETFEANQTELLSLVRQLVLQSKPSFHNNKCFTPGPIDENGTPFQDVSSTLQNQQLIEEEFIDENVSENGDYSMTNLVKSNNDEMEMKRRFRTNTYSENEIPESPSIHNKNKLSDLETNPHLGSRISLDHRLFSSTPPGTSSFKHGKLLSPHETMRRHRRNDEYTSITDTISVVNNYHNSNLTRNNDKQDNKEILDITTENDVDSEYDFEEGDNEGYVFYCNANTSTLKRANPSFVNRQNDVFRQLEEEIGIRDSCETSEWEGTSSRASKRNSNGCDDLDNGIRFTVKNSDKMENNTP